MALAVVVGQWRNTQSGHQSGPRSLNSYASPGDFGAKQSSVRVLPRWGPEDAEIKVPSVENPELSKVLCFQLEQLRM